ncbi:MAG TPA: alpha/beta fold hydrolase, partial [Anaerolineae bacterium]|nr:alpha/beta fold hydrolase [Anaerolineae bacterium]
MSLTVLDRPEILRAIFHPRREYPPSPRVAGARFLSIEVEPHVSLGARLFPASRQAPAILYWHGNGEIAADYDGLAPLYTQAGITLLVVDYRGYGTSDGSPTCSNLLSDAVTVFDAVQEIFERQALAPLRLYVMGRSLGSAAAIEVATRAADVLAGLILESGFADTFALLARLGIRLQGLQESQDGFNGAAKMELINIPTLVIHGEQDVLIPAQDGEELFRRSAALDKRLLLLPGAGHNDLLVMGGRQYMESMATFVFG